MLDLSAIPVVDNHCHAYLRDLAGLDVARFRRLFSEARSPMVAQQHVPHAIYYRWALKEMGRVLGCDPNEEEVLERRAAMAERDYIALLLGEANIEAMLIDTGLGGPELYSLDEMRALTGCRIDEVLRLETLAQDLIAKHTGFSAFVAAFEAELVDLRERGIVSLKSIAAYRSGLDIHPVPENVAAAAYKEVRATVTPGRRLRLANKPLIDYLVHLAMRQAAAQGGVPIQFHTGYGDPDTDLRLGNPLHLRQLYENPDFETVPIVMLHESYPFTRDSAYLAAVYPNAYLDLSYSVPFVECQELLACTHQALGVAPWSKVLYSSDGFGIPEHGWLGAIHGRRILGDALEQKVEIGELDREEALEAAAAILHGNSRRVYG